MARGRKLLAYSLIVAIAMAMAVMVFLGNLAISLSSDEHILSLSSSLATPESANPPVSASQAAIISADALSYVKGESLSISYPDDFRAEELSHLSDVRNRISAAFRAFYFSAAAMAILLPALLLVSGRRIFFKSLRHSIFAAGIITLVLVGIAFLFSFSFDSSFTAFHKVVFGSSQWSFPADYLVVNLFTEAFFAKLAAEIFVGTLISGILLLIFAYALAAFSIWHEARRVGSGLK